MKPTRCCVLTQRGTRCANEPSPVRPVRMIGPVRLAACGLEAHQRALWSLPGFVRHDAYCGAFGCDRPSNAGICPKHRDMYRDFGITEHMLLAPQEAPMTEPTPPPKLPELGFRRVQIHASSASLADLEAAATGMTIPTPPAAPQEAADGGATPEAPKPAAEVTEADFADVLDALDVHTVPEPTRTGRTNLCGGTGEQMDPLAYDGWSDKPCPGCDGCKDVEPETAQPHGLHPFEARRASLIARLYMAGFAKVDGPTEHLWCFDGPNGTVLIPVGHFEDMLDHAEKECAKVERATAPPATVEEFLRDLESGDGEPSEGDVADAQPPTLAEVQAELKEATRLSECRRKEVQRRGDALARMEVLLKEAEADAERERNRANEADGLRIHAETDLIRERERADAAQTQLREALADLAAIAALLDPEDSPAFDADDQPIPLPVRVQVALMPDTAYERELRKSLHAVEAELFEVDRTLQHLGAYDNGPTIDRLMKVLTAEDRRNILELQAAEARMDLARLRARRLDPAPPEHVAELVARVEALDARIAALDAGEVRE